MKIDQAGGCVEKSVRLDVYFGDAPRNRRIADPCWIERVFGRGPSAADALAFWANRRAAVIALPGLPLAIFATELSAFALALFAVSAATATVFSGRIGADPRMVEAAPSDGEAIAEGRARHAALRARWRPWLGGVWAALIAVHVGLWLEHYDGAARLAEAANALIG